MASTSCSTRNISLSDFQKKFLICSICYDMLKEPKVLPCLHTYCKVCLLQHTKSNGQRGEVKCPNCSKTLKLSPDQVDNLPDNFYVNSLLEEVNKPVFDTQKFKENLLKMEEAITNQVVELGNMYVNIDEHYQTLVKSIHDQGEVFGKAVHNINQMYALFCQQLKERSDKCKEVLYQQQEETKALNEKVKTLLGDLEKTSTSAENLELQYKQMVKISEHNKTNQCKAVVEKFTNTVFVPGSQLKLSDFGLLHFEQCNNNDIEIKSTDMNTEMKETAKFNVEKILSSLGHLPRCESTYKEMASQITEALEYLYGKYWHCGVGIKDKFGLKIHNKASCFLELTSADLHIVIFKSHGSWFD